MLLVDDDPSVRTALSRLLRSSDLDVETFASAGEFLDRERPVRPACLLVDIHLPDMNGLVLLRRILAEDAGLPVVIITGEMNPQLKAQALQEGAAAFLKKPFDDEEFLAEVRRALSTRRP